MRYKIRIQNAIKDFNDELKGMKKDKENKIDTTDANNYETMQMIRAKSQIKAKCIIDHLELRSLDASNIADELLKHYKSSKNLMVKSLIIAMILVCMTKCNRKIGNVTKNILAAQSDTTLITIMLDSLKNHQQYDNVIILTLDCIKAYLETCKVYKQGIFREQEMLDLLLGYTQSSTNVQLSSNNAIRALVMFCSIETVNRKNDELVKYAFDNISKIDLEKSQVHDTVEADSQKPPSASALATSRVQILQAISSRFENESVESQGFLKHLFDHFDKDHWESSEFIIAIMSYICTKQANQEGDSNALPRTINKVIQHIYARIATESDQIVDSLDKESAIRNLELNGKKLNHSVDTFNQYLVTVCRVLAELYNIRGDSLALNHSNEVVFATYQRL